VSNDLLSCAARSYARTPAVLLVGNKSDLATRDNRPRFDETAARAAAFVENHAGVDTLLTSARTGEGVQEAFVGLARKLLMEQASRDLTSAKARDAKVADVALPRRSGVFDCCTIS
jgi:hypothetical protein